MTWRERLRVMLASVTNNWHVFTCGCGKDVWVSDGAGKLLDGQMCDACESKAFAVWEKDYTKRMNGAAA